MEVRVLGCSGGIGAGYKTTCLQVGETILVDAGTGLELLSKPEMVRLKHVFLTHSHLDHIACLPLMLAAIYDQREHPLAVYGSAETLAALREHLFNWTIWPDYTVLPSAEAPSVRLIEFAPGTTQVVAGVEMTAVPVCHPTVTQGYLVRHAGESLVFTGDTGPAPQFWQQMARQADLKHALVDVSFPSAMEEIARLSGHYTPAQLAADLKAFSGRPRLHISHIKPGFESVVMSECRSLLASWTLRQLASGDRILLGAAPGGVELG